MQRPDAVLPPSMAMMAAARTAATPARPARPLILAIDFDETLVRGPYPQIQGLLPGAREAMMHFKERGHTLIIWTCRSNARLVEALDYLRALGVPFDYANENTPQLIAEYGNDSRKIFADLYLDDRAAGAPAPGPGMWYFLRNLVDHHAQTLA